MSSLNFTPNVSQAAQRDIIDLQQKIEYFQSGEANEEAFRKFRLARGVYGQRQAGVQMIRIKLPYGRITADQLIRIADCSDKYATGNLHATTRQDIQLHFVKLSESPALWADLEDAGITLREACGNTVRNVTASPMAGIDPNEPFDVTPITHAIFEHFLRNPICQDMGRKFKIAVSSSVKDTAYGFMHDIGLIPIVMSDEREVMSKVGGENSSLGFKVLVGGGLGAQPLLAQVASEFVPIDEVIPFIEAVIRVFDRYGERVRRHKARMKFLLADIGLEEFLRLVNEERLALKNQKVEISDEREVMSDEFKAMSEELLEVNKEKYSSLVTHHSSLFQNWLRTNVLEQKQKGWYAVGVRVLLGDMSSDTARAFAAIVKDLAADDIRVTQNQGYLLRFVKPENLLELYERLNALGLANAGFDTTADITTCPGTDTCNLAISSSYGITRVLEEVMFNEFPDIIYNNDIKIKISGCMNGCGQHSACNIGFHGSSIKNGVRVLPALQVLLGGGFDGQGNATMGDKVVKIPTKRGPDCLRLLLNDYDTNAFEGEYFNNYYQRQGNKYFYALLKPLADMATLTDADYVDWDHDEPFKTEIGVGECASVLIDLVSTTFAEAQEKIGWAYEAFDQKIYADAIYHAYNVFITGAKALLITKDVATNTQYGIVRDFDANFIGEFHENEGDFKELVFEINKSEPTEAFAKSYIEKANQFLNKINEFRQNEIAEAELKEVVFGLDS